MVRKKITRLFDLKGAKTSKKKLSIRLVIRINGEKYYYYVGHTILPEYWNYKKQCVKTDIGFLDSVLINNALDETSKAFDKAKYELIKENTPVTKDGIVRLMNETLGKTKPLTNDLWGFVNQYIENSKGRVYDDGRVISPLTIKKYKDCRVVLQKFETYDNCKMRFDNINVDWFERFKKWCIIQDYAISTVDKVIETLKTWLNNAVEKKITDYKDYKMFKIKLEKVQKVYLTDDELWKIHTVELPTESLENVRDLFLLGCFTALRYSDVSTIKREHIKENEGDRGRISIHQAKTGDLVTISIDPRLRNILEKRNWEPPRPLSNQKFNEYVKEVCKLAGINDPIEVQKTRGGVRKKEIKEKWELITSHTARRTFASNLYLEGVPIKFIMKFTGHKTIQSFMSYIHVTDEEGYEMVERIMGKKYDVRMAS